MNTNIKTFEELFDAFVDPDSLVSSFVCGHLTIEFLLLKLIEIKIPEKLNKAKKMTHSKLIDLIEELELLQCEQCKVLKEINLMRNKFAHNLGYRPSVMELREIFIIANECFIDETDGFAQGLGALKNMDNLDVEGPFYVSELFMQISYNLLEEYTLNGGDYFNLTNE